MVILLFWGGYYSSFTFSFSFYSVGAVKETVWVLTFCRSY